MKTAKKVLQSADDGSEDFVSKETLNRRQDRKLMESITSLLYRMELDNVKPSSAVMNLTTPHHGVHQQKYSRRRRQQKPATEGDSRHKAAPGEKLARSKKWEKIIGDYQRSGGVDDTGKTDDQKLANQDGPYVSVSKARPPVEAAAAASAVEGGSKYSTLPGNWRFDHHPDVRSLINGEESYPKLVRSCLIRVEDLPDRTSTSSYLAAMNLGLYGGRSEQIPAASTYVPRSKSGLGLPRLSGGSSLVDSELMSYIDRDPGWSATADDTQFRQEVIKSGRPRQLDLTVTPPTSSRYRDVDDEDVGDVYLEQLRGGRGFGSRMRASAPDRQFVPAGSGGSYPNMGRPGGAYRSQRLPYSPQTIVTGPDSRYSY
jgi:hypothetical protein